MENKDLKLLKKHYGENFAHLCRSLFPTLLENEGLLYGIISKHFAPSRSLYEDVLPCQDDFKTYIFNQVDVEQEQPQERVTKTPVELLDEAGYVLFPECQTEEDVQSFKKYWAKGEELCTFRGGRLNSCRVWFAVKKNVDQIKREDFKTPTRQDEYGTSAISIQFSKGANSTLSIKNRYNHTVNNPDATFNNNLDNIIPDLQQSFFQTYGIHLVSAEKGFELPNYRLGDDGKFYRENWESLDVCYCENNVVLDHGHVVEFDKARYVLAENYIIDKQKNEVKYYGQEEKGDDSFVESLGEIESIATKTDENGNKVIVFTPRTGENVELTLNQNNAIVGYSNPNVTEIGDDFLPENISLTSLSLPNLKRVGDCFLTQNRSLTSLYAPKLKSVGNVFLSQNEILENLSCPKLKSVGDYFLCFNKSLTSLSCPNLESVGNHFLRFNESLVNLYAPKLKSVGSLFLCYNKSLTNLYAPKLKNCPDKFKSVLNKSIKEKE